MKQDGKTYCDYCGHQIIKGCIKGIRGTHYHFTCFEQEKWVEGLDEEMDRIHDDEQEDE